MPFYGLYMLKDYVDLGIDFSEPKVNDEIPVRFGCSQQTLPSFPYKFPKTYSVIICRMCFSNNGSVTPWRCFG